MNFLNQLCFTTYKPTLDLLPISCIPWTIPPSILHLGKRCWKCVCLLWQETYGKGQSFNQVKNTYLISSFRQLMHLLQDMEKLPENPGLTEEGRVLCRSGILTITLMLPLSSMVSKTETNTKNYCSKIMEKYLEFICQITLTGISGQKWCNYR